ncbi:hypothetical protein AMJ86_03510 [bacterium SM23_57]|nr:MAG: hypothetical protein AMJ86_03510 [bacterium SM23_57]
MKQLIVFTVAFLIVCGNLIAQPPDTLWSRIHSISPMGDIDDGKCVRQTTDGGYIITGSCVPNGLESHVDLLLLKTDTLGHILWTQTYGRGFVEEGLSVEQTSDGGYIIGGRAVSGVYPVVDPPYSDVWMLKTDSYGDTLWTKTYGDSGTNEYCTSIQQTPDLGYIMTGTMNSEYCYPNYEINEEYDPVASRAWLLRTDSSGDTLWTKFYLERSYGNSVVQTSDGGFVITGWVFPDEQDIQSDVLLIKTDSSGDTLWTKTIEGADYEVGFCARQTYDGYVLVGQTKPAGSRYNALLIKTDLSGEVLWTRNIGGDLSDAGFTVEVASDGGFFITGTTNGNWWVHQGDMWAFKTDANGSLLWEVIYDLALCDFAWCGIQTSDNGYVLTGMTSSGFGGNLWLAKLGHPSGVRNRPSAVTDFALHQNYPNPFNASTTISYDIPKPCWVNIYI